jgi:hypothetical protein
VQSITAKPFAINDEWEAVPYNGDDGWIDLGESDFSDLEFD